MTKMTSHQQKTVSHAEAVFEFLHNRGFQLPGDASLDEREALRQKTRKQAYHNTELLLTNYRNIVWQTNCEIDTISGELNLPLSNLDAILSRIDAELGMQNRRLEYRLERLAKTRQLLDRINDALTALKAKPGNGAFLYDLVYLTYIADEDLHHVDLLDRLHVSSRHFYRLKEEAINIISLLLWSAPSEELELWLELVTLLQAE